MIKYLCFYKCRWCSVTFYNKALLDIPADTAHLVENILSETSYITKKGISLSYMLTTHECTDRRIGCADFVGARVGKDNE